MKYLTFILFIMFSSALVQAQNDETILNSIFYDLFEPRLFEYNNDTLFINSTIYKTRFEYDSISFENESGLKISERMISEFRKNVEKDEIVGFWNAAEFNKKCSIFIEEDTIVEKKPFVRCLSEYEKKTIFDKIKKRQKIFSISKLQFDNNRENAIFNLYSTPFPGEVGGYTIFITKIYGKWVIVARFGYFMS